MYFTNARGSKRRRFAATKNFTVCLIVVSWERFFSPVPPGEDKIERTKGRVFDPEEESSELICVLILDIAFICIFCLKP